MRTDDENRSAADLTISYRLLAELAAFQEQYQRLSEEIQQACIQLENSPELEPGTLGAAKREEWRAWLKLQISSRQQGRQQLVEVLERRGIRITDLPE